ncbi:flavin-containing monooxygenase 5-like [Uloborus diversus]|uniref:flavin-containing monooxygenase 5-like n=1 Tax=Uloborus diversus TaxID=327109 RepID=UPI0024093471|nr:flavin-containing monooxygenase 5-like [Uloborus diversus]XP_054708903.1 flavin-containing monooxygenase 5-like [Uloborus diversus]
MKICVIGAGSSGLAAIKACKEENLDVICYEKSENFGGLWRYHDKDDDGQPSVMKSTIINTSKELSAFSDFPPPKDLANYMHNTWMLEYFSLYAEHFDLLKHIKYTSEVIKVEKAENYAQSGKWAVSVKSTGEQDSETNIFDGVMVCAGHHIYPHVPNFNGLEEFKGKVRHTHSLKSSNGYENLKALVIGIGNSAVDAAVELCKVTNQLYLSSRKGSWIFSRIGPNGMPYDVFLQKRVFEILRHYNFFNFANFALEYLLNFKFDHAKYGLKPKHRVLSAHPTINDALPNCILSGRVVIKQNVKKFTKQGVIFEGEDEEHNIDAVIMATGYEIKFPFVDETIFKVSENSVELYKFVFPPQLQHPSLAFIALVQPLGAMFPIAEAQSRWFVQLMLKKIKLPSKHDMEIEISKRHRQNRDKFVPSLRHTIQVFWISYMDEICSEFGAKPNLWKMALKDPKLAYLCYFGPCTPYQYRLQGPHTWEGAREAIFSAWERIEAPLKTCKRA